MYECMCEWQTTAKNNRLKILVQAYGKEITAEWTRRHETIR
jgi:hypothetical protein